MPSRRIAGKMPEVSGENDRPFDPETRLRAQASLAGRVPPESESLLAEYLALVARWNRACNLTAVDDPAAMVTRHVLDSATALPFLHGRRMLDAGSGAGFPGLVLAALAPDTHWVLVESAGKKARFLDHAVRRLGLSGRVAVHQGRLECYRPEQCFDTVTARALAELALLAHWVGPLLAPVGRIVALKGRRVEIAREVPKLGPGWHTEIAPVEVPGERGERHVVVLERTTKDPY